MLAGPVLVLLFLFVIGPILLFLVGGIWSALNAWLLSDDAERRGGQVDSQRD